MLTGRSIVCFAHDWAGDPTSKTHIMRILSAHNRILWVNSIGMRRPSPSAKDMRRLLVKLKGALRGCQRVNPGLYVFSPLVLPLPGFRAADRLNVLLLSAALRYHLRRLGMRRPILWTFLPNVNALLGRLDESLVIYHCVDEYTAFTGVPGEALARMERELVERADLVFASSEELCRDRRRHNPRTYFVSHGVDVDHFSKALDPRTSVPLEMQGLHRPIVGFFGLIADWVDLDLVGEIARRRPDWSIVMVGKTATDLTPLRDLGNVHLTGQQPYEALPGYCRAFDVGIIPFRVNNLTLKANPLKLREYLAAGLPVVATDLPEVRKYRHMVRLASAPEAFVEAIERSFCERHGRPERVRVETMRGESWDARVAQLSLVIDGLRQSRALGPDPVGGTR